MQDRGPLRLVADGSLADHTSDMEQDRESVFWTGWQYGRLHKWSLGDRVMG